MSYPCAMCGGFHCGRFPRRTTIRPDHRSPRPAPTGYDTTVPDRSVRHARMNPLVDYRKVSCNGFRLSAATVMGIDQSQQGSHPTLVTSQGKLRRFRHRRILVASMDPSPGCRCSVGCIESDVTSDPGITPDQSRKIAARLRHMQGQARNGAAGEFLGRLIKCFGIWFRMAVARTSRDFSSGSFRPLKTLLIQSAGWVPKAVAPRPA